MPSVFELNPSFCFTLLGAFVIYVWTRPRRWAWLTVLLLAAALRAACVWLMGGLGAYYGVRWISWGAFLGIASLMVLAVEIVRAPLEMRPSLRQTFYAAAVFPLCSMLIGYTLPLTTWLRPKTYDAFLLAFDGGLGFQPSFVLGRLLLRSSTCWGLTTIVYYALPLAGCVLYAAHRRREWQPVAILPLLLSLAIVGFTQYGIFPAVGPTYAFQQSYPLSPPKVAQIAVEPMSVPDAPRNCMPSLHLAGALVVWWNSRIWPRWGRLLTFLFLLATIFSTLALGEHYLADLVAAFPFTLVFQAAWTRGIDYRDRARQRALWAGLALTVAWFVALRYWLGVFLVSPAIAWGSILFTVGWCVILEEKLSFAAQAGGAAHSRPAVCT